MSIDFLGIARERVYSPGKVEADRAILDAVAERLAATHRVRVANADEPLPDAAPAPIVFAMCQGPAALETLRRWEASGVRVINSVAAIENTHRRRMLAAFERRRVRHPESRLIHTAEPGALPEWIDAGAWIKRGDVHATEPDDVVRVDGHVAARAVLAAMHGRGIASALVQRHVEGEVVKFYAVRGAFFAAFPFAESHPSAGRTRRPVLSSVEGPALPTDAMRALAEAGAAALELEVFGGDCVCDEQASLWLIDLNDWPSYGACRSEAADAIASYLTAQSRPT